MKGYRKIWKDKEVKNLLISTLAGKCCPNQHGLDNGWDCGPEKGHDCMKCWKVALKKEYIKPKAEPKECDCGYCPKCGSGR